MSLPSPSSLPQPLPSDGEVLLEDISDIEGDNDIEHSVSFTAILENERAQFEEKLETYKTVRHDDDVVDVSGVPEDAARSDWC